MLVEQHVQQALALTQRCIVLERGRVVHAAGSRELAQDEGQLDRWLAVRNDRRRTGMNAAERLLATGADDAIALECGDDRMSYAQLRARSGGLPAPGGHWAWRRTIACS